MNIDFEKLNELYQKPKPFSTGTSIFWKDDYISKNLLQVHIDPDVELASRNPSFIEENVKWILTKTESIKGCSILDLGCGPGLYANKIAAHGTNVTGIDFSKRSIEYAQNKAEELNLSIDYRCMNYLDIDFENEFDIVLLIYYDFAVLSPDNQITLLKKISKALKNDGLFIFDILTEHFPKYQTEKSEWFLEEAGFWRPEKCLCLHKQFHYSEIQAFLDQFIIIDENGIEVYKIWDQYYSKEKISKLLSSNGFSSLEYYENASGKAYSDNSETMCVVAHKDK